MAAERDGTGTGSDIREWNAASYHRVANPHVDWGRAVLDRLPLRGDETVLDAGCGTGRLTELVLEQLPRGKVIALDQSANMLDQARASLEPRFGDRVVYLHRDLLALDREPKLDRAVDVVFSTATFHWVRDHAALFRALLRVLKPGGRLVAQCGGGPNIAAIVERATAILRSDRYAPFVGDWPGPWEFADPATTADRLRAAGFVDVETGLVHAPVTMPDAGAYREFLTTVVLGTHLERIHDETLRREFIASLVDAGTGDTPPFVLDYWRLNLQARRPTAAIPAARHGK